MDGAPKETKVMMIQIWISIYESGLVLAYLPCEKGSFQTCCNYFWNIALFVLISKFLGCKLPWWFWFQGISLQDQPFYQGLSVIESLSNSEKHVAWNMGIKGHDIFFSIDISVVLSNWNASKKRFTLPLLKGKIPKSKEISLDLLVIPPVHQPFLFHPNIFQ